MSSLVLFHQCETCFGFLLPSARFGKLAATKHTNLRSVRLPLTGVRALRTSTTRLRCSRPTLVMRTKFVSNTVRHGVDIFAPTVQPFAVVQCRAPRRRRPSIRRECLSRTPTVTICDGTTGRIGAFNHVRYGYQQGYDFREVIDDVLKS